MSDLFERNGGFRVSPTPSQRKYVAWTYNLAINDTFRFFQSQGYYVVPTLVVYLVQKISINEDIYFQRKSSGSDEPSTS